jgi:hypothetical protein
MEKYLLCELNDENYTDASYTFHKTYEEAKIEAIVDCVEQFDGDCEVETDNEGFRISSSQGDNFFVTEIKQIATTQGTHLLVWHHGYEGVDFEVRFQGTYEECKLKMKEDMDNTIEGYEVSPEDVCHNVIDTGNEWEVWDIVEIEEDD